MIRILFGIFVVLHGLVHLLYFGQSARFFEMQPGMVWPDGSWLFSKLVGDVTARTLANGSLILAAIGLVVGGAGMIFKQAWSHPILTGAAIFSTLIYIIFWNGKMQNLDTQGGIGILINLAILASLYSVLRSYLKI